GELGDLLPVTGRHDHPALVVQGDLCCTAKHDLERGTRPFPPTISHRPPLWNQGRAMSIEIVRNSSQSQRLIGGMAKLQTVAVSYSPLQSAACLALFIQWIKGTAGCTDERRGRVR